MQPQQSNADGLAAAAVERSFRFWRFVAWVISLAFLAAAAGAFLSRRFASGIFLFLCGTVLFPPLNLRIRERTNGTFSRKVTAVTALVFLIPSAFFMSREVKAGRIVTEKRELPEQRYRDSIRVVNEKKQRKEAFLAAYPFVDAGSYDYWMMMNEDSATTPSHTVRAFLEAEKRKHELKLAKEYTDSVEAARFAMQAEKKREKEEFPAKESELSRP